MEKVCKIKGIQKALIFTLVYIMILICFLLFDNLDYWTFGIMFFIIIIPLYYVNSYEIDKNKIVEKNLFKKNRVIYFSSISIEDFKDERDREKYNISFLSEDRQKPFELEMNKKWGKKIYCFLKDMNVKIVFKNKERKWHCD